MIHDTSWSSYNNLYSCGKCSDLSGNILSAINCQNLHTRHVFCKITDIIRCLHCQFSCRAQYNGLQMLICRIYLLKQRNTECCCFTCSGLCLTDNIFTLHHDRNSCFLNRRHIFKSHFRYCMDDSFIKSGLVIAHALVFFFFLLSF